MSEETQQIYAILMVAGIETSKGWDVLLRPDPEVRGCWLAVCIHERFEDRAMLVYTSEHISEPVGFEEVDEVSDALKYFPSDIKERMNEDPNKTFIHVP